MPPPSRPTSPHARRQIPQAGRQRQHAFSRSRPVRSCTPYPCGPESAEDLVLGLALTTTWMLKTGRHLRCRVPLMHDLTAAELIDFWADDHIQRATDNPSGSREQVRHDSHSPHSTALARRVA
jgi:hypothetical protein